MTDWRAARLSPTDAPTHTVLVQLRLPIVKRGASVRGADEFAQLRKTSGRYGLAEGVLTSGRILQGVPCRPWLLTACGGSSLYEP